MACSVSFVRAYRGERTPRCAHFIVRLRLSHYRGHRSANGLVSESPNLDCTLPISLEDQHPGLQVYRQPIRPPLLCTRKARGRSSGSRQWSLPALVRTAIRWASSAPTKRRRIDHLCHCPDPPPAPPASPGLSATRLPLDPPYLEGLHRRQDVLYRNSDQPDRLLRRQIARVRQALVELPFPLGLGDLDFRQFVTCRVPVQSSLPCSTDCRCLLSMRGRTTSRTRVAGSVGRRAGPPCCSSAASRRWCELLQAGVDHVLLYEQQARAGAVHDEGRSSGVLQQGRPVLLAGVEPPQDGMVRLAREK